MKPYDLVIVKQDKVVFVGEIISKPIGDGNIMVRLVPGDPNTMIQLPMNVLSTKLVPRIRYIHYARVRPVRNLPFPDDMLRYDNCVIVEETSDGFIVARATVLKTNCSFTVARWVSFGWDLEHLKTIKYVRGS